MTKETAIWSTYKISESRDIKAEWDALNQVTARSPMQDFCFWQQLLEYFGSGDELLCLCRSSGKLVASTIVEPIGKGRWQTSAPAQAPIGAWLSTDALPLGTLLEKLIAALPGPAMSVGVTRQDPAIVSRPSHTSQLSTLDYIQTGRIYWEAGFDGYWARRGKNLRQNLRRQRNRLARENIQTRLRTIRDAKTIGDAVDAYGHLESAGWKAETGTALHPENKQGKFYRRLFETYSEYGESVIYEYYFDADLVAVDLCLRRGSTATILKTTHDERQSRTSPALLMRQESIREMLDCDGIVQIEFYGKKMDWHTKWTEDFRRMYHINYDRFSVLSWLRKVSS